MNAPDELAWTELYDKLAAQGFTGSLEDARDMWLRASSETTIRFLLIMLGQVCGNKAIKDYVESIIEACRNRGLHGVYYANHRYTTDELSFTMFSGRRSPETGPVRVTSITIEVTKISSQTVRVDVEAYRNSDSCKFLKKYFNRSGKSQ